MASAASSAVDIAKKVATNPRSYVVPGAELYTGAQAVKDTVETSVALTSNEADTGGITASDEGPKATPVRPELPLLGASASGITGVADLPGSSLLGKKRAASRALVGY